MKRLLSLDVLRGIAVLLVIVRHCEDVNGTWLEPIRRGGWVGVDLFFVLSGFLVSGLLFREFESRGEIKAVRFLVRRGWKIYPAFWALVAVTVAVSVLCKGDWGWQKTLAELSFVQSYVHDRWWGHTWSLAVEEHFYVLLPLLLVPLSRQRFVALPRLVFCIFGGLLLAKCINGVQPFDEQKHLFPTHLRLDGLFVGVLLSHWHHSWPQFNAFCKRYSTWLIGAGVIGMLPAFMFEVEKTPALYTYWLSAQIVAASAILMGTVCGGVPENIVTKGLGWIGYYSYSIYLWHNFVRMIAMAYGLDSVFVISLWSVLLGVGMSKVVESPCLWLRELFTKPKLQVA